jgi:hypothetical protein
MKVIAVVVAPVLLALSLVAVVNAAPASGTTAILGKASERPTYSSGNSAFANTPTDVDVSIVGGAPIVPYEYSVENRCWFSGRTSGPSDSYERFDLIGPWFNVGGKPHTTVTVNNNPVPTGSCKVAIVHNNTSVKGSTTTYAIQ